MKQDKLDLYTDFLLSVVGQATATGLSNMLDGAVSHDEITRFLSSSNWSSKELWLEAKPLVRQYQSQEACLIFDDTIIEKEHTDANALICYHYNPCTGQHVKGINVLTAFYHSHAEGQAFALRIPVSYALVTKPIEYLDTKTRKSKRKSQVSKNEMLRSMVSQMIHNQLPFKYVLADSWYASSENMRFIEQKKKFFIFPLKSNRLIALNQEARHQGNWTKIENLDIPNNTPVKAWLKDLEIPIFLIKQVLTNKDSSTEVRFLVSNDFSLSGADFTTLYNKRWSVEEYHKSLKQHTAVAKSPTRTIKTQSNHLFASVVAYLKLEKMKLAHKLNHFALKSKIYLAAIKEAFKQIALLKQQIVNSA